MNLFPKIKQYDVQFLTFVTNLISNNPLVLFAGSFVVKSGLKKLNMSLTFIVKKFLFKRKHLLLLVEFVMN